jgi:hypothetical protein
MAINCKARVDARVKFCGPTSAIFFALRPNKAPNVGIVSLVGWPHFQCHQVRRRDMSRPERPLDPSAGPVQSFAAELRLAREKAGSPKYLQMARVSGRSRTALAEAAGGDHLATWETVEAYLIACHQNPADWYERWESVRLKLNETRSVGRAQADLGPQSGGTTEDRSHPGDGRTAWWLAAASLLVAASATAVALGFAIGGHSGGAGRNSRHIVVVAGPVLIVQNKVAVGRSGFFEDITPSYLSTRTDPACAHNGCEVAGTQMSSGVVLHALCQIQGTVMTNEDLASPGIDRNPAGVTSALWYRAEMANGKIGYISEVYLTPASRGGLGLQTCPAK